MRKKGSKIVGLILVEGALLCSLIWILGIDRNLLIIQVGTSVKADQRILLYWIAWGVLAVLMNAALLWGWLRGKKRVRTDPIKLVFSPDKAQNPEEIRRELTRFKAERPQLEALLEQGLDQLDNIARKKEKMAELLERNDVSLLGEASEALSSAEQTLCRKLILVLNRALLCDPEEENARRKQEVYLEHARYMQAFLNENEDVLNRCEKLLAETVRYVEEKKAGRDTMDLQIMTDVIHSLYNDGIRMEIKEGENVG